MEKNEVEENEESGSVKQIEGSAPPSSIENRTVTKIVCLSELIN